MRRSSRYHKAAAAALAVCLTAALGGCGVNSLPADGWQIAPPTGEIYAGAEPFGPTTALSTEPGFPSMEETTTLPVSTEGTTATTASAATTTQRTSRKTTTTTKPIAVEDDPLWNREEESQEDTPTVTLPNKTTTTAATTTTTASETTAEPTTGGTGTTAATTQVTSAATTATTTTATTTGTPPQNGWYKADGKEYYYQNGKPVTGFYEIGGEYCAFDDDGVKLEAKVGIDVSTFQGSINWEQVKEKVDFAIIRVGLRGWGTANIGKDARFEENIKGATAAGIDCGVYFFSQAITVAEAIEEANFVLDAIKPYKLTYPVVIDMENPPDPEARTQAIKNNRRLLTDITLAFCETIRDAGYYPMVYSGASWLNNNLYGSEIAQKYDIWVAHYGSKKPGHSGSIWQYSSSGRVDGITTNVDLNVSAKDYAAIIREQGLNHL